MKVNALIKNAIKRIVYQEKYNSQSYVKYLRSIGMKIGEDVTFYAPIKTSIDTTRPWMIEIGDHVKITEGVTILTHGYDWSVLKGVYGEVLGSCGKVKIKNNVFIGMHTTILKGVSIGENVIIGANSLVNKDIPDNVVAAGNPCKVIMSLEEYHEKRVKAQYSEAAELVRTYRQRYGKEPDTHALREFFWLFCDGETALPDCWTEVMKLHDNYDFSSEILNRHKKQYIDLEHFLKSVPQA